MLHPLAVLGAGLVAMGTGWIGTTIVRLQSCIRVQGKVLSYKEVSNVGLADSMDVMIVQYTGFDGKKATCSTKPRTSFFSHAIGDQVSVYLFKDGTHSPIIGEFAGLWLMPLVLEATGFLCLALALS